MAASNINDTESALYSCDICFDDSVPLGHFIHCTRLHGFCKFCVSSYAEILIRQGRSRIPCLLPGCRYHFPDPDIREALDVGIAKIHAELRKKELTFAIRRENELKLSCPSCFTPDPKPISDTHGKCVNPECQKEICLLCSKLSHVPLSCEQARSSLRNLVAYKQSEAIIRHCPQCQFAVIKEDGCNSMDCSNCSAAFCYLCEQDISGERSHFGTGKCAQFLDEQDIDKKNVEKAKNETIREYYKAMRLRRRLSGITYSSWANAVKGKANNVGFSHNQPSSGKNADEIFDNLNTEYPPILEVYMELHKH